MEITVTSKNNVSIVTIVGKLDGSTADSAQQTIMPLIEGSVNLVFDMAGCDFISSAGLRILLMIAKKLKMQNGVGAFANLSEEIIEVMDMTGFGNMFENYTNVENALSVLG